MAELRGHRDWLADKAAHCPENFLARHALVSGEIARLEGRDGEAMDHYEQAARAAQDAGLLQFAALANELCARFHVGRGRATAARVFLREARDAYERWGAEWKVQALGREHPSLLGPAGAGPGETLAMPAEHFDLLSATKASQVISGHIVLDKLAAALVTIALEQGGAERGLLILGRDGDLLVEAEAKLGPAGPEVTVLQGTPLAPEHLAASVARFAWRTGERVILDAEGAENRFATDPYFGQRRPRSLLCLPIAREASVVGLLYLENAVSAGAFTPGRLAALELLAAQATISLENASLLRREQAARTASEAAERRAEFLAEASAVLAESLDHTRVLSKLVHLVAGRVAESCVIDVVEQNEIHHVAVAHVDPSREPGLAELQRRYPARWDSPHSAALVVKTGAPVLVADVASPEASRYFLDDEHRRATLALGTRTTMTAPIVARGRTLGAISVGWGRPQPDARFGREELALLEELAHRTAMAIDNAHLYRQAQEASRLRDEFLSVASHELNTPMVSLILTLQSLIAAASSPEPEAPRMLKMADLAERQGQRLRRLISDLLDVTRIERGPLPLRLEPVDLEALVREALARSKPELAKAGCEVTLTVDAGPEGAPILGRWDPQRVDQVIVNVLSNAAKFGREKPVEITVQRDGVMARVSVTDHGIGIEPRQQALVFNRFARGVSALHYGGLGLGLYICRRIVDAHGGALTVRSEPGQGATFVLELPLA
jgi:signal transduction histidine kinase